MVPTTPPWDRPWAIFHDDSYVFFIRFPFESLRHRCYQKRNRGKHGFHGVAFQIARA